MTYYAGIAPKRKRPDMQNKPSRIVDIQIAPCSMKWENMKGNERVRRCQACKLNVYNAIEMSEFDLLSLVKAKEGDVCLRIFRRFDGRILTKDCASARIYRGVRLALTGLCALLGGLSVPPLVNWLTSNTGNTFSMTIEDDQHNRSEITASSARKTLPTSDKVRKDEEVTIT